jgi:hypothetical protein
MSFALSRMGWCVFPWYLVSLVECIQDIHQNIPVGEEQAKSNGLKNASQGTNGNGIDWALLCERL